MFRINIPLAEVAVGVVGPGQELRTKPKDTPKDTPQDTPQDDMEMRLMAYCELPRSKAEILSHFGYKDAKHFMSRYVKPLLENGRLTMTIPNKPTSKNQRYVATGPGGSTRRKD